MYLGDDIKLNPSLGTLSFQLNGIIFFLGNKYFRMWSRKGKHWFQITNDLPNSVWGSVHMLKQMFVLLCFGSEITHQSRCPQQATCFPFAFSRSPESPLVGHEVVHPHPISVSWVSLSGRPWLHHWGRIGWRWGGGVRSWVKNRLELSYPGRGFGGTCAGRFSNPVGSGLLSSL